VVRTKDVKLLEESWKEEEFIGRKKNSLEGRRIHWKEEEFIGRKLEDKKLEGRNVVR